MTRQMALAAAAVAVGWTAAVAADPPDKPRLPAARQAAGPRSPTAPLSPATLLAAVQAEREAYNRRLDVCHRLREVAVEVGDDKLEVEALDLEQKATALYQQRVAKLGVKSDAATAPMDALDRTLGGGVAVTPLTRPSASSAHPETARLPQYREVAP